MTEPQQEPVSWHYVWLRVLTQAHQQGRSVEQAIADADQAVAAYRQRLAEDRGEVDHD
jgi:predicted RNase H-like HicB family nuclease